MRKIIDSANQAYFNSGELHHHYGVVSCVDHSRHTSKQRLKSQRRYYLLQYRVQYWRNSARQHPWRPGYRTHPFGEIV